MSGERLRFALVLRLFQLHLLVEIFEEDIRLLGDDFLRAIALRVRTVHVHRKLKCTDKILQESLTVRELNDSVSETINR